MKKTILFCLTALCGNLLNAQTLLIENFDFTGSLTSNGWGAHFSSGVNAVRSVPPGLTYTGYQYSGVGNTAFLNGDGEDVNRTFTTQTSGSLYASFMVSAGAAPSAASHFLHFGTPAPSGTSTHFGRLHLVPNAGNFEFGISRNLTTAPAVNTNNNYTLNTTYVVVLKYTFVAGANNDEVKLYVFDNTAIPATEPAVPTLVTTTSTVTSEPASLGSICLRQFSADENVRVDGIIVSQDWFSILLPAKLVSFTGRYNGQHNELNWQTVNEYNNRGFDVEHSRNGSAFEKIGFVAARAGTANRYNFNHQQPGNGLHFYRLKQTDLDGRITFSPVIKIENDNAGTVKAFFNAGGLTVQNLPVEAATLQLFSANGQLVSSYRLSQPGSTVFWNMDKLGMPGIYYLKITGINGLNTGISLLKL
jgi:hypothetical protein